jgi:uncharacterized protein YuzE
MKQPIRITVDPECPVAYVEYRNFDTEADSTFRVLREPDGRVKKYDCFDGRIRKGTGVHVDLNENDEIVGIEIIDVDEPDYVAIARDYARDNDLAFPDDIRTAAAARDSAA